MSFKEKTGEKSKMSLAHFRRWEDVNENFSNKLWYAEQSRNVAIYYYRFGTLIFQYSEKRNRKWVFFFFYSKLYQLTRIRGRDRSFRESWTLEMNFFQTRPAGRFPPGCILVNFDAWNLRCHSEVKQKHFFIKCLVYTGDRFSIWLQWALDVRTMFTHKIY